MPKNSLFCQESQLLTALSEQPNSTKKCDLLIESMKKLVVLKPELLEIISIYINALQPLLWMPIYSINKSDTKESLLSYAEYHSRIQPNMNAKMEIANLESIISAQNEVILKLSLNQK